MLKNRKKGGFSLSITQVLSAIILLSALILIIGIIYAWANAANKELDIVGCRASNEMRYAIKEKNPLNFAAGPRACQTIHQEIPLIKEGYPETTEGAKMQIRDMVKNCWNMWLEGEQPDILSKGVLSSKQPCFICYTFTINKGKNIKPFSIMKLEDSMNDAMNVKSDSDNCNPLGGGKCLKSCPGNGYPDAELKVKVKSSVCKQGKVCCIAEEENDKCVNNGGYCGEKPTPVYSVAYSEWRCAGKNNNCYVKPENYKTYMDYINNEGKGYLLVPENLELEPSKLYAVTFLSPGKDCGGKCQALLGVAAVATGVVLAATGVGLLGGAVILAGSAGTRKVILEKTSNINELNAIFISEYERVENYCDTKTGD